MKTYEELYDELMAKCGSDDGRPITSARIMQASLGGILDEAGVFTHMRKLTEALNKEKKGSGSQYVAWLDHFITVVGKIMREEKSKLFHKNTWEETRATNILAALETEAQMLSGAYDEKLLRELRNTLYTIKEA